MRGTNHHRHHDVDEVQFISLSAYDRDEIQQEQVFHVDEVQTVKLTGTDRDEVQTISFIETLERQRLNISSEGTDLSLLRSL